MRWRIRPSCIAGTVTVPGDKSISHRALMLAAVAEGASRIRNLAPGGDVRSTLECLRLLGTWIEVEDGTVTVSGGELRRADRPLSAGNSGTTMRLLSGILAGQPFETTIRGDRSLESRPMGRIVEPLERMGARIQSTNGRAPLRITGAKLYGIEHRPSVPSAQVKSAVLLAGLFGEGRTAVHETAKTRDHTERMLDAAGVPIAASGDWVAIDGPCRPHPLDLTVAGDFSSAAFLLAAAALTKSTICVTGVGLNPTRTAFLDVLGEMGCRVMTSAEAEVGGEPVGSVSVSGAPLRALTLAGGDLAPMLDEAPLIALLASAAEGETHVTGGAELRVKESDRIATMVAELSRLGASIEELADGFVVRGPTTLRGTVCQSHLDHRVAMTLALAGLIAEDETVVEGVEAAAISYPGFVETLRALGGDVDAE